jgi:hypothetical protein
MGAITVGQLIIPYDISLMHFIEHLGGESRGGTCCSKFTPMGVSSAGENNT